MSLPNFESADAYAIHWTDQKLQLEDAAEQLQTIELIVLDCVYNGEARADLMRTAAKALTRMATTLTTLATREDTLK